MIYGLVAICCGFLLKRSLLLGCGHTISLIFPTCLCSISPNPIPSITVRPLRYSVGVLQMLLWCLLDKVGPSPYNKVAASEVAEPLKNEHPFVSCTILAQLGSVGCEPMQPSKLQSSQWVQSYKSP